MAKVTIKEGPEWACADPTEPLRFECRLVGPEAEALRAAAHPGDTVPDALRRFIDIALHEHHALNAAEEREKAFRSNFKVLADAYQGMVDAYNVLITHLPEVFKVQQETAAKAAALADDGAMMRSATVGLAKEMHAGTAALLARNGAILTDLEAAVRFLDAVVEAWSSELTAVLASQVR